MAGIDETSQIIQLTILNTNPDMLTNTLGEFLFLFGAAYRLAYRTTSSFSEIAINGILTQENNTIRINHDFLQTVNLGIMTLSFEDLNRILESKEHSQSPSIDSIEMNSPLKIGLRGIPLCIVVAVALTGGSIRFMNNTIEAQIDGLPKAIVTISQVFQIPDNSSTGYGVKEIHVVLDDVELGNLMKRASGSGGFQTLIRELQNRVNKTTRTLILYPRDVDKILRYGNNPQKGGFQSRIVAIFGRQDFFVKGNAKAKN